MGVQMNRLLSITAYFACGSMVLFCLFRKIWLGEPNFPEKQCSIPPCRRRSGPFVQTDAWFEADCVTRVIYTTYAVVHQTGRFTR